MNPTASEPAPSPHTVELDRNEALKLLGTVQLGRAAFTDQALPTIRPHGRDGVWWSPAPRRG
ncbi:hypothetical protein [Streptomyces hokutonensis]|uniref:hypothetical protein n=1 Tax=Streptomyces hokutonensis TaxID=1306990 RepID=UPI003F53EA73